MNIPEVRLSHEFKLDDDLFNREILKVTGSVSSLVAHARESAVQSLLDRGVKLSEMRWARSSDGREYLSGGKYLIPSPEVRTEGEKVTVTRWELKDETIADKVKKNFVTNGLDLLKQ